MNGFNVEDYVRSRPSVNHQLIDKIDGIDTEGRDAHADLTQRLGTWERSASINSQDEL